MVCKEEVCAWFKDITGAERIELLCSLLHMCVPMELRFIGSCLEDLARKDFIYLRDAEIKANDIAEIKKLKHDFMDEGTRSRVSLYLALLYSTNNACSHTMFELLSRVEPSLRQQSAKCTNSVDTTLAEDAVLILAMAANHPAFTFSQRQQLYRDLKSVEKLQQNLSDSGKVSLFIIRCRWRWLGLFWLLEGFDYSSRWIFLLRGPPWPLYCLDRSYRRQLVRWQCRTPTDMVNTAMTCQIITALWNGDILWAVIKIGLKMLEVLFFAI